MIMVPDTADLPGARGLIDWVRSLRTCVSISGTRWTFDDRFLPDMIV